MRTPRTDRILLVEIESTLRSPISVQHPLLGHFSPSHITVNAIHFRPIHIPLIKRSLSDVLLKSDPIRCDCPTYTFPLLTLGKSL
jgi:hypothetical protein